MLKFNIGYFIWAVVLFGVEVVIDLYVHDAFIRPFFGDFLVVILLYCCFKSFLSTPVRPTAIVTLLIAYLIETLQYFHFIYRLSLQNSGIARAILGTSFAWGDLLAYTLGISLVMLIELTRRGGVKHHG